MLFVNMCATWNKSFYLYLLSFYLLFIYSHGTDLSFTQNCPDSLSEWLTHTVQGLEYLEANWVNVVAGDALDPRIARSSTAMTLIIQMGILMWSLRANLNKNNWNACVLRIPPAASWLTILLSHIGSQVKRWQSQIYKLKELANSSNFCILKQTLYVTHLLKLLDKMCKYEMDLTSIVEDTQRTLFSPQTDRQTDGQGETCIPPFQLHWSGGIITCDFQVFGHN